MNLKNSLPWSNSNPLATMTAPVNVVMTGKYGRYLAKCFKTLVSSLTDEIMPSIA